MMYNPRYPAALAALALVLTGAALGQADAVELRYATSAPPKTVWEMQVVRFQKQVEEEARAASRSTRSSIRSSATSRTPSPRSHAAASTRWLFHHRRILAGAELSLLNIPFLFKDQKEQDCVLDKHLTKITRDVPQEGRGVDQLERGGRGRHHRQEAFRFSRRPQGARGTLGAEQGRRPHVEPVRGQPQSAARDRVELRLPDRPHRCGQFRAHLLFLLRPLQARARGDHDPAPGPGRRRDRQQGRLRQAVGPTTRRRSAGRRPTPAAQLRTEVRGFEGKIREMHKPAGGTIVEITAEQRAVWRKGIEAAWPKMVEAVGGESNAYWKAIQAGIRACSP